MMFVLKLAIFETGIAEIHDMMTFNVPNGLKFIAASVVLMGCITLYYQAATSFYMDLRMALALLGAFLANATNATAATGLALPLKAVVAGTHRRSSARSETLAVKSGESAALSRMMPLVVPADAVC